MIRSLRSAMVVLATSLACSRGTRVPPRSREVLYIFPDSPTLFVVDPASGRVIAAPGPVPHGRSAPVFSSDSSTLYFSAGDSSEDGIFALDSRSLTVHRVLDLRHSGFRKQDSLRIFGDLLATAPNSTELFDGTGMVHDRPGQYPEYTQRIAAIDIVSGEVSIASDPLSVMSLTPLPAGEAAPKGGLIVLPLNLPIQRELLGWLMLYDPVAHAEIDSFPVPSYMPGTDAPDTIPYVTEYARRVVTAPDGRHVYVLGWNGIYGYDLVTRNLFAIVHAPSYDGRLALSHDGTTIYFLEDIVRPVPMIASRAPVRPPPPAAAQPSRIRVFDAQLVEGTSIPFGAQFTPGFPSTRPYAIAVSGDDSMLYLTANTPGRPRPGNLHVLVLKLATGKIVRDISLHALGGAGVFVGH
jgi:hypothetical protein